METTKAVGALGALAQETRLAIFRLLVQKGPDGLSAGLIGETLGVPPSSLSFHLAQLAHAGLVNQRRVSRNLIYAADFGAMNALMSYLTENCCGREASCAPACSPGSASLKQERVMKRLHVHVAVDDLAQSVRFYSTLFAAEPTVTKTDYAKWMLEDPRVNFAISKRGEAAGVQHLGIQVEDESELADVYGRLEKAERPVVEEKATTCCYARSDKQWIADPQGIAWETFLTHGESTVYGTSAPLQQLSDGAPEICCEPAMPASAAAPAAKAAPAASSGCCAA